MRVSQTGQPMGKGCKPNGFSMDCQNNSLCDKLGAHCRCTGLSHGTTQLKTNRQVVQNQWFCNGMPHLGRGLSHLAPLRPLSDMFTPPCYLDGKLLCDIYLFACKLIGQCPMSILMNDLSCKNQAFS